MPQNCERPSIWAASFDLSGWMPGRSVAPGDVDGPISAASGDDHALRGAARHIGTIGRHHRRRIPMRPVPGNVIGGGVTDVVRDRRRNLSEGFAGRTVIVSISACDRPEGAWHAPVMPEGWMWGRERAARRCSRSRESLRRRRRHQRCNAERRNKGRRYPIRHGTHQLFGYEAIMRTLSRAPSRPQTHT